jgi:hypothetical protein
MKKILIAILFFLPFFGFGQARTLFSQYSNGMPGKILNDTVRTLVAVPPLSIVSGGTSLVDSIKYSPTYDSLTILVDAATITWDYSTQTREAKIILGGNRSLLLTNLPTNRVIYLTLTVIQDGTGSRTLTLPSGTKVINGSSGAVSLTATANATDILSFRWTGTTLFCTYGKNYN